MALSIYQVANPSTSLSAGGTFTNPLVVAFDGVTGNSINKKLYVRNNDLSKTYSNITVTPYCSIGTNIINGTNGFGWKLIVGDTEPLSEQWSLVAYGNSISIPNISDINTYEPFWLRITVPRGALVQSYSNIKLIVDYTETIA